MNVILWHSCHVLAFWDLQSIWTQSFRHLAVLLCHFQIILHFQVHQLSICIYFNFLSDYWKSRYFGGNEDRPCNLHMLTIQGAGPFCLPFNDYFLFLNSGCLSCALKSKQRRWPTLCWSTAWGFCNILELIAQNMLPLVLSSIEFLRPR